MSGYSSREEFLSEFDMTEEDVEDVAKEMALDKMVAKTIAAKEGLVMDDAAYKEKLIEYMEYEDEADKKHHNNIIRCYDFSERQVAIPHRCNGEQKRHDGKVSCGGGVE